MMNHNRPDPSAHRSEGRHEADFDKDGRRDTPAPVPMPPGSHLVSVPSAPAIAATSSNVPPVLAPKTKVRGWTVTGPVENATPGMHEVLAEDAAGACVVLRVPADADTAKRMRAEADLARLH